MAAEAVRSPVIVVHGGAWAIPSELTEASLAGVKVAARRGWEVLKAGGSALDAVEQATRALEDDPAFDAGHGAVLNERGEVELDAVIMDGATLRTGAVAAIGPVANPVSVARMVMERTPHVLLVGDGATAFATQQGVPLCARDELVTPAARAEWNAMAAFPSAVSRLFNLDDADAGCERAHDTVGAVAVDADGGIAAATSTGGITFKKAGRVGDSPLVGSGAYADADAGAISCTGHGESLARVVFSRRVLEKVERGVAPAEAASAALEHMSTRVGGRGGAICVSPSGAVGVAYSTSRMAWACMRDEGGDAVVRCGIDRSAPDLAGDGAAAGGRAAPTRAVAAPVLEELVEVACALP